MKVSVCKKFWSFNQEPLVCDFFVAVYEIYAHISIVVGAFQQKRVAILDQTVDLLPRATKSKNLLHINFRIVTCFGSLKALVLRLAETDKVA